MANGKPCPAWFLKKATGPIKWCKYCGRKHRVRDDCGLRKVIRTSRSGRDTERYALRPEREKSTKKNKARKS